MYWWLVSFPCSHDPSLVKAQNRRNGKVGYIPVHLLASSGEFYSHLSKHFAPKNFHFALYQNRRPCENATFLLEGSLALWTVKARWMVLASNQLDLTENSHVMWICWSPLSLLLLLLSLTGSVAHFGAFPSAFGCRFCNHMLRPTPNVSYSDTLSD